MAEVTARPAATAPPAAERPAAVAGNDWTTQAADTIESFVTTIRDKTVVPATTVARAVVYGLVAGVLGLVVLVLVITVVVRFGSSYLPGWFADRHGRSVWVTEAALGGILAAAGLFLLRRANATQGTSED